MRRCFARVHVSSFILKPKPQPKPASVRNCNQRLRDIRTSDLTNRGSQLASTAGDQAKTFAAELEGMARRNPLGALAGAVAIGVFIGVMGRRN